MPEDPKNPDRKKIARRQVLIGCALIGAAATGAVLMRRFDVNHSSLITIDRALTAQMKAYDKAIIFETPIHGSFVIASVVSK